MNLGSSQTKINQKSPFLDSTPPIVVYIPSQWLIPAFSYHILSKFDIGIFFFYFINQWISLTNHGLLQKSPSTTSWSFSVCPHTMNYHISNFVATKPLQLSGLPLLTSPLPLTFNAWDSQTPISWPSPLPCDFLLYYSYLVLLPHDYS